MGRVFIDLWVRLPNPGKGVMALAISGVAGKWVFDDFRHSRISAMTWFLATVSVVAFMLAVAAIFSSSN
jgi:hypothetical protein